MRMFDALIEVRKQRALIEVRKQKATEREGRAKEAGLTAKQRARGHYDKMVCEVLRELADALGKKKNKIGVKVGETNWVLTYGRTTKAAGKSICKVELCFDRFDPEENPTHFEVTDFSGYWVQSGQNDYWKGNWWETDGLSQKSLVRTLTKIFSRR